MQKHTHRAMPIAAVLGMLAVLALAVPATSQAEAGRNSSMHGQNDPFGATPSHGHHGDPLGGPKTPKDDDEDGPVRPVPEPGTMSLVAMGVVALGAGLRRHRNG